MTSEINLSPDENKVERRGRPARNPVVGARSGAARQRDYQASKDRAMVEAINLLVLFGKILWTDEHRFGILCSDNPDLAVELDRRAKLGGWADTDFRRKLAAACRVNSSSDEME